MSDLIVVYSLSGKSRQDALWLASGIGAEVEEIVEERPRSPASTIRCLLDSLFRRRPAIKAASRSPEFHDRVILICPVWAGRVAGPVRTWLAGAGRRAPQLALLVQSGKGSSVAAVVGEIEALAGKQPIEVASVTDGDFDDEVAENKVRAFGERLRSRVTPAARSSVRV